MFLRVATCATRATRQGFKAAPARQFRLVPRSHPSLSQLIWQRTRKRPGGLCAQRDRSLRRLSAVRCTRPVDPMTSRIETREFDSGRRQVNFHGTTAADIRRVVLEVEMTDVASGV